MTILKMNRTEKHSAKIISINRSADAATHVGGSCDPKGEVLSPDIESYVLINLNILKSKKLLFNRIRKTLLAVCILSLLAACKKEAALGDVDDIPGLGGDTWVKGSIDHWIYDSLTHPYNIAVKYKWDQFELELNKTLVPPKESKVIPVMDAVKKVWLNTYIAEAGELFIKKYCPKFFVLVGSANYNTDGTVTLGTAESGRKVVLYVLNDFRTSSMPDFRPSDSINIKQMFHTIEHEFAHVLHQNTMYPEDYRRISLGLYTANWNNIRSYNALRDGFITPYAMSRPDEDFAEMIAMMLVEGRTGFEKLIGSIPAGISDNGVSQMEAQSSLRQKEAIIVSYFKEIWDIDFYSLQARTRNEVEALIR